MNTLEPSLSVEISAKSPELAQEEQLVAAAQLGSTAAFSELQAIYEPKLFNRILRITRNREDAEDALQDTFLHAYLAIKNFEKRAKFSSWLTRIAINSALMVLRKRRKRAEVLFDFTHENGDEVALPEKRDSDPNPEQAYAHYQQGISLLSAIKRLEPKLRSPLEIHIYRDCSLQEIARMLEISVPAVKARLHRARRRLVQTAGARDHRAGGHLSRSGGVMTSYSPS